MSSSSNDGLCGDKGEQPWPIIQTSQWCPNDQAIFCRKGNGGAVARCTKFAGHSFRVGAAMTTVMVAMKICQFKPWVTGGVRPIYYIHQNSKGQVTAYVLETGSRET